MMKFEQTCGACPEQYDVFDNGRKVGYVRLRHGHLYAAVPDVGGDIVYSHDFPDVWQGHFETEAERKYHLTLIEAAIRRWINAQET